MLKATITLTLSNEHGEVKQDVYECEGATVEEMEKRLVTQVFVDGAGKLVDSIYEMTIPAPKPKKTRAKKKPAAKQQLTKLD